MVAPVLAAGLASAIGRAVIIAVRIYAVSIIAKIFATIGVGIFVYTYAMPEINAFIASQFSSLPAFVRASVGAAGLDKMITMIVSAAAVRRTGEFAFKRLRSD